MTLVAVQLISLARDLGHTCALRQRKELRQTGPDTRDHPLGVEREHPGARAKPTTAAAPNSGWSNGQIFLVLIVFFQDSYQFSCYFVKNNFQKAFLFSVKEVFHLWPSHLSMLKVILEAWVGPATAGRTALTQGQRLVGLRSGLRWHRLAAEPAQRPLPGGCAGSDVHSRAVTSNENPNPRAIHTQARRLSHFALS